MRIPFRLAARLCIMVALFMAFIFLASSIVRSQTPNFSLSVSVVSPRPAYLGQEATINIAFTNNIPVPIGTQYCIEFPVNRYYGILGRRQLWEQPEVEGENRNITFSVPISSATRQSNGLVFTTACATVDQPLGIGNTFTITYTGFVQNIDRPVRFKGRVTRPDQSAEYYLAGNAISFNTEIHPTAFNAVLPADIKVGESFSLEIVALDRYGNRIPTYHSSVNLSSKLIPVNGLPSGFQFSSGYAVVNGLSVSRSGFLKILVGEPGDITASSNYAWAHDLNDPAIGRRYFRRLFGDLHFQTGYGTDGVFGDGMDTYADFLRNDGDHNGNYSKGDIDAGGEHAPYIFARDTMLLDFAALTEHVGGSNEGGNILDAIGYDPFYSFMKQLSLADKYNAPGEFTTLYGYEWGGKGIRLPADAPPSTPWGGHHTLLFYNKPDSQYRAKIQLVGQPEGICVAGSGPNQNCIDDRRKLFRQYERDGDEFIAIPHTMSWYGFLDAHPIWGSKDTVLWPNNIGQQVDSLENFHRPVGEVYSGHNTRGRESANGGLFENELGYYKDSVLINGWDFRTGWREGNKIGNIGSSDNHLGTPGINNFPNTAINRASEHGGLAVILSDENDRDSIWEALTARRVYGTSGARIYLDLTARVDGNVYYMGEEFRANSNPEFNIRVAGTNIIRRIELIKYNRSAAKGYVRLAVFSPNAETFTGVVRDDNFIPQGASTLYYLRVIQDDDEAAWSSPIWIEIGTPLPRNHDPHVSHYQIPTPIEPSPSTSCLSDGLPSRTYQVLIRDLDGVANGQVGLNDIEIALSNGQPSGSNPNFAGFVLKYDYDEGTLFTSEFDGWARNPDGSFTLVECSGDGYEKVLKGRWGRREAWGLDPQMDAGILKLFLYRRENGRDYLVAKLPVDNLIIDRVDLAPNDGGRFDSLWIDFDLEGSLPDGYSLWVRAFDRFGDIEDGKEVGATTGWIEILPME